MKSKRTPLAKAHYSVPSGEGNQASGEPVETTQSLTTLGAAAPDPRLKLEGRAGTLKREIHRIEVRAGEFRDATRITLPDRPAPTVWQGRNSWLEERLTSDGKEAFQKLCDLGCDREELGALFTLLAAEPIRIRRKLRAPQSSEIDLGDKSSEVSAARTKPRDEWYQVSLHPLDRLEAALRGSGEVNLRELQRTAQRAKKLRNEVIRLKRTPFVRWLQHTGYMRPPDLLSGLPVPGSTETYFRGVLSLPRLAKQVGARKRPDFERQLKKIYQHIYEHTSGWHDDLAARILNDLFLCELGREGTNADALRKWRDRHGLTGSYASR